MRRLHLDLRARSPGEENVLASWFGQLDADSADLAAAGILDDVSARRAREKLVTEADAEDRDPARTGAQEIVAEPQHPGRFLRHAERRAADDDPARAYAIERRPKLLSFMRTRDRHLESKGALEPARVVAVQLRRPGLDDDKSRTGPAVLPARHNLTPPALARRSATSPAACCRRSSRRRARWASR